MESRSQVMLANTPIRLQRPALGHMSHEFGCRSLLIMSALGFNFLKNNMLLFKGGMVGRGRLWQGNCLIPVLKLGEGLWSRVKKMCSQYPEESTTEFQILFEMLHVIHVILQRLAKCLIWFPNWPSAEDQTMTSGYLTLLLWKVKTCKILSEFKEGHVK